MFVTVGTTYTCTISAVDGDGDDIYYEMTGAALDTATFNNLTRLFSWTPSSTAPVDIGYFIFIDIVLQKQVFTHLYKSFDL